MNENTTKRTRKAVGKRLPASAEEVMSQLELLRLGGGQVAYIKILTTEDAKRLFPAIEGLPPGTNLFALHGADGSPIALTDTRQAAMSHAMDGDLMIASLH